MACRVAFSPEAQADLFDLYAYIAPRGGSERALAYIDRIEKACMALAFFPNRGTLRSDVRAGLRVTGFESRVTIAFHLESKCVVIDRILYGGRALEGVFEAG